MTKCRRFLLAASILAAAILPFSDVFGGESAPNRSKPESPAKGCVKRLRWHAPDAEAVWEKIIQSGDWLPSRMDKLDATQAEGQLEAFGTRYMPNAYTQYQDVRAKALELQQIVKESFPQGASSDPTGEIAPGPVFPRIFLLRGRGASGIMGTEEASRAATVPVGARSFPNGRARRWHT